MWEPLWPAFSKWPSGQDLFPPRLQCLCDSGVKHEPLPVANFTTETNFSSRVQELTPLPWYTSGGWMSTWTLFLGRVAPERRWDLSHKAQFSNLWLMTSDGVSQLNVGIVNTLADGKRFLGMQ